MAIGGVLFFCTVIFSVSAVQHLKWSNGNCASDDECYSKECSKAHRGTDARCARGSVLKPCFADYHCETGLQCGEDNSCCAPYWGICLDKGQCCDSGHVCRPGDGYNYNRCLLPVSATRENFSSPMKIIFLGFFVLIIMRHIS